MAYKSKTFKTLLFILLLWACPALAAAVTPPIPAQPHQYVVDLAGVIDSGTQAKLNAMLHDLEAKTTAQVVVLTLKSLDGTPIEEFSHQTAVKWGIGQKGKDNGVLLTVAVKDHKYRPKWATAWSPSCRTAWWAVSAGNTWRPTSARAIMPAAS